MEKGLVFDIIEVGLCIQIEMLHVKQEGERERERGGSILKTIFQTDLSTIGLSKWKITKLKQISGYHILHNL